MSLADEYRRQNARRTWGPVLDGLGALGGARVLDLGCGGGDVAAELAARGARVVGLDANAELLAAARARAIPDAELVRGDFRCPPFAAESFDGIWCSFGAAYLPDLAPHLRAWRTLLVPGGWIALTEVDDLFAHEPLLPATRALLDAYALESAAAGRYDFRMGRALARHLAHAGFRVVLAHELADPELARDGPASADVRAAWAARLARMQLLRARAGAEFEALCADFLGCLASPEHRTGCRVVSVLARRE